MQDISQNEIEKLLSIIPPYPGTGIFHMCDNGVDFSKSIDAFCKEKEYVYHVVSTNEAFVEKLQQHGLPKARKISYKQQRYNQHSKEYEFIYLEVDVEALEKPELFFKKIYHISKNAAKILFFVPKEKGGFGELEFLLDKANFVAINPIDDMFENYLVLSAQKMHGWGVYDQ